MGDPLGSGSSFLETFRPSASHISRTGIHGIRVTRLLGLVSFCLNGKIKGVRAWTLDHFWPRFLSYFFSSGTIFKQNSSPKPELEFFERHNLCCLVLDWVHNDVRCHHPGALLPQPHCDQGNKVTAGRQMALWTLWKKGVIEQRLWIHCLFWIVPHSAFVSWLASSWCLCGASYTSAFLQRPRV